MGATVDGLLNRYFAERDSGDVSPAPFLLDAHCHLGFVRDPAAAARAACRLGVGALSCTVTPREYLALRPLLSDEGNVVVGAGLHPWWVGRRGGDLELPSAAGNVVVGAGLHPWWVGASGGDLELLAGLVEEAELVGEVGLDFSPRHVASADEQVRVLETALHACARAGGRTVSVHCVRAYDQVFELLERTRATDTCRVVFHWFSGTGDDLARARQMGCWFSVGPRMLATRRGRAYARQMPRDRLLLETDGPAADALADDFVPVEADPEAWRAQLERTAALVG